MSSSLDPAPAPDLAGLGSLAGRTALVTGGTGGIGEFTALGLASLGARVIVTGRDRGRGEAAVERLRARSDGEVELLLADLASLAGVRALAAAALERAPALDLLVNNAGALPMAETRTADGIELSWAVNHLAPFLLTGLLLPGLRAATHARVANLSSGVTRMVRLRPADVGAPAAFAAMPSYGRAKVAALAATSEWAARLAGTGVVVHAADPGGADTPMTQAMTREAMPLPLRVLFPLFERFGPRASPAARAARSTLVAAASPPLAQATGQLVAPSGKAGPIPRRAADPALRARVWEDAAATVGLDPLPREAAAAA